MILHKDIQQGSTEWHEIKRGKIGGTRNKNLFVESDNLILDLMAEITEEFDVYDDYQSKAMEDGIEKEPFARKELESVLGIKFNEVGWIQSEESDLLGISPDGITEDETEMCEIKCPEAKRHLKTVLLNDIPNDNTNQCLHYFVVNKNLIKLHFFSFRPESNVKKSFLKTVTVDSLLNFGTEKTPKFRTISEMVAESEIKIKEIETNLKNKLNLLTF
jgi:predicted phage-related endonuclease